MSSASAPLHRRVAGVLVAAMLCLLGGVVTGAAATADTGHPTGVVKYCDPNPPKPVVVVQQVTATPSCETPTVQVGTITTTTPYVWGIKWTPWGPVWDWVPGTPSVVSDLHDVSLSAEELAACNAGPQPEPLSEVQAFTGEPSCETPTVMVGEIVTTTPYVLDVEAGEWVLGEPVVDDQRTELSLTEEEMLACQIPEKPEDVVEVKAYTAVPSCAAPTVLAGDVTTTTGWVLDSETNTWVPGEPVVDDGRVQVSLTPAELAACVPTQPTQPTVPTAPTAPTAPLAMAQTGSPTLAPALTALGMVLMGATALVARRRIHA